MATPADLLKTPRYKNLFKAIADRNMRKMPCGEVRVAMQLRAAGLIRLVGNRQDITTAWEITKIGETYVS